MYRNYPEHLGAWVDIANVARHAWVNWVLVCSSYLFGSIGLRGYSRQLLLYRTSFAVRSAITTTAELLVWNNHRYKACVPDVWGDGTLLSDPPGSNKLCIPMCTFGLTLCASKSGSSIYNRLGDNNRPMKTSIPTSAVRIFKNFGLTGTVSYYSIWSENNKSVWNFRVLI